MQEIIEKLRQHFPNLFEGGGVSFAIEIVIAILGIAFLWFVFFAKKSYKNPLWAIVITLIGFCIFMAFFIGGMKVGKLLGIGPIGALGGVFLFFFLATVLKYYTTPKEQRRKKFM